MYEAAKQSVDKANLPSPRYTAPGKWYTSAMETKPTEELTEAQAEIVGQFNDYSFENPKMTFEEIVLKEFGPDLFPGTPGKAVREGMWGDVRPRAGSHLITSQISNSQVY